jgi:hypothetical protein
MLTLVNKRFGTGVGKKNKSPYDSLTCLIKAMGFDTFKGEKSSRVGNVTVVTRKRYTVKTQTTQQG